MSIKDIHASDDRFSGYPLKNFKSNYKNLKKKIEEMTARVELDNKAVREHHKMYPRPSTTKRGYPHWDTHPAKEQLENDVRNGTANEKTPRELWMANDTYKEFPPDVFCKRVQAEKQKQRGDAFWVEKRNRKAMKERLVEVGEIK